MGSYYYYIQLSILWVVIVYFINGASFQSLVDLLFVVNIDLTIPPFIYRLFI